MTVSLPLQIELLDQMTATAGAPPVLDRAALTETALGLAQTHQLTIAPAQVAIAVDQVVARRTPTASPEVTWNRPATAADLAQQRELAWHDFVENSNRGERRLFRIGLGGVLSGAAWLGAVLSPWHPSTSIFLSGLFIIPLLAILTIWRWANPSWSRGQAAKARSEELRAYPVTPADLERWSKHPHLASRVRALMLCPTGLLLGDRPELQALEASLQASVLQTQVDRFLATPVAVEPPPEAVVG